MAFFLSRSRSKLLSHPQNSLKLGRYMLSNLQTFNFCTKDNETEMRCLMMRGIPYNTDNHEVYRFFHGFGYVEKSLKLELNRTGRMTGRGSLLFRDEEKASHALTEKQGQNIRHRYIELFLHDVKFHLSFGDKASAGGKYLPLSSYITDENQHRVVALRGLPFTADSEGVVTFMQGFELNKSDVVIG